MLTKLILENYIPLLSSEITKVELDVAHMVNLFIAANGTGKTSILKEMNPLPPENGNYAAGGRKYVEIRNGTNHYVLDSKTGVGNGHSFVLNGKELNKNGTYSEQKDLVWNYFKLDGNINRILSGLKAVDWLSMMSVNRRKEFFLHIYPNDTTHAIKVYNNLRAERNELKAAIKNQVMRYADENRKLNEINEFGVDELERRIKEIEDELRQSLLVRGGLENITVDPELQRKIYRFGQLAEQLTINSISGFFHTEQELRNQIELYERVSDRHEDQAAAIQLVISEHAGILEGMEELVQDPLVFHHQAEQLQEELTGLEKLIEQHTELLQQYELFKDPEFNLDGLDQVREAFVMQLHRVVKCSQAELTGAEYKRHATHLERLTVTLREVEGELSGVTHQLKHYDSAEAVQCPDCEHEFKVGVSAKDIDLLRQKKEALGQRAITLQQQKQTLTGIVENDAEWYQTMMALYQFCRMNEDVKCLAELVKVYDIGKAETTTLLNALRAYADRFECQKRMKALLEEQDLLNTRIGLLQRDTVLDVANYVSHMEKELEKETRRVNYYKTKTKHLMGSLNTIVNHNSDLEKLRLLREEILEGLEKEGLVDLRRLVDERISLLTDEKDDYLRDIIKSRSLTAVVNSISDDIERLKKRLKGVTILMDGLCPNKGLVGRLMTDFIKTFCGNMNAVIQAVWNTSLYVKPCNKENGDLTYKFPVVTGDKAPTPDVQDCSLGEAGIIDFAFRYVAMSYHGYDYPLIMDEVAPGLDEIKRGRFFSFIQDLTSRKDAKQLFMVSHYLTQYGTFTNSNVVAMRYEGLSVIGEVNKHSTII